ncbi:hypothetical protein HYT33_04660 [Candidatus Roizmanbacteria bacterium]|nr:hypothetical protein [Candidatus Roizmanbacteria bacterium]
MVCPNCSELMKEVSYDNQRILHCSNCGASFFEENGINRITFDTAKKLSEELYSHEISAKPKSCPKDATVLTAVSNTEAVPPHVILFVCKTCEGVFAYPDDLLKFKRAQGAKIDYFKAWQAPFASLRTVLVVFAIAVFSVSVFYGISSIQKRTTYQTEASDVLKTVRVFKSGRYILVSFKTKTPFRSAIVVTNKRTGEKRQKTISQGEKTLHTATLSEFNPEDPLSFHIILYDRGGSRIETQEKTL